jgi:hypothetical protein
LNDGDDVLEGFIRELIVRRERTAHNHVGKSFAVLVLVESDQFLFGENWLIYQPNLGLPNSVDVKLLGVHESLGDNDLAFKQ